MPTAAIQFVVLDSHGHGLASLDFAWEDQMVYVDLRGEAA